MTLPVPGSESTETPAFAPISVGEVVVALSAVSGVVADKAPEWIKIAPRGRVTTRPGPSYAFDPETLAARFKTDDVCLPIDIEHATVHLAARGERADAVAWIEAIEARPDGIYGRVDWLETGKAVLAARTHRYVSPTFNHDADGNATWLHSVALVTAPALSNMPAIASAMPARPQTENRPAMDPKKIRTALGLPETADETAVLSAIGALRTVDAKKLRTELGLAENADETAILSAIGGLKTKANASGETTATLSASLDATKTELATLRANMRKSSVTALLDAALTEKRILPAERASFESLAATDEGLTHVTALLAARPKGLGPSGLDERKIQTGATAIDPVTLAASANTYLAAQQAAGNPIGYVEAFAHVHAEATKGSAT